MENYLNYVIVATLALIVLGIVVYLVRAKRRGERCIGCPASKQCHGKCGCSEKKDNEN